jgi:two-component system phosphate regulon response regulator PhoB
MAESMRVVAVYASSPALTAILGAVLAAMPGLRVRRFDSQIGLTTYMRLSPVDVLVCDFDCEAAPAGALARSLRSDDRLVRQAFAILALTGSVDADLKQQSVACGIDEVIVKPMSPKYLLERVLARLKQVQPSALMPRQVLPQAAMRRESERRDFGSNVVPLFRDQPLPLN